VRNNTADAMEGAAMAETQAQMAARAQRDRPRAGENLRERLLAGMPVVERRLQLAGISTAVLEGGDGPPVVLLHGPGAYAAHWMWVIPGLAAAHRVIAPDLPGHGASEAGDGTLDADRVLAWLGELVARTCASPPALVGQLLGGAIAARFAGGAHGALDRLVLVDTFGLVPFAPAADFAFALTQFLAQPDEHTHERLWRHCAFDLDRLRQRVGERWEPFEAYNLDRARGPGAKVALPILMEQFGVPAIPPAELARIAVPTTLIWGRHDLATPLRVAEAASARYGWPLHVIENAADDPPVEQPEALLRVLRAALGSA
jgi:pimeloyl-ACP methyl ester carboxylesterase